MIFESFLILNIRRHRYGLTHLHGRPRWVIKHLGRRVIEDLVLAEEGGRGLEG